MAGLNLKSGYGMQLHVECGRWVKSMYYSMLVTLGFGVPVGEREVNSGLETQVRPTCRVRKLP